jgi:hypothetical protein
VNCRRSCIGASRTQAGSLSLALQPEEAYNLYTDDTSLKEMLGRWIKLARILQAIYLVLLIVYAFFYADSRYSAIGADCILFLVAIALFEVAIRNMKRKRVSQKPRHSLGIYGGYLLFGAMLLTMVLTFHLILHPIYTDKVEFSEKINQNTPDDSRLLTVKKAGNYELDVRCKSERGIVMIRLERDNKVLYHAGGAKFNSSASLKLKPGYYTVYVTYYLEDYKEEFDASQSELKKLNLTGDLNQMSDVSVFVGIKR